MDKQKNFKTNFSGTKTQKLNYNQVKFNDEEFINQWSKKQSFQHSISKSSDLSPLPNYRHKDDRLKSFNDQKKDTKPFLLKRTMYVIVLLAFMMIICFYFDLIGNYNFLSLILGFIACIIFQVNVLQYLFKKQMTKMQIDEYGALRAKIKYLFGELNTQYLDKKNRKKYYHHTLSQQDKIFNKQNEDIYDNTMQYLISKSKVNHIENIQKINKKWQVIITKYQVMKKFVTSFMQIHSSRVKIYNNFLQKINNTYTESDYSLWNKILKTKIEQKQNENKQHKEGIYSFFQKKKPHQQNEIQKKQSLKQNEFTQLSISEDGFSISQNNTYLNLDLKNQLLELKQQSNLREQKQQHNSLGWKQLIGVIEYRHRINNKKISYMKQSILDQLKLTSEKIKIQKDNNIKQLDSLKIRYEQNVKQKQQIINQVHKLKQRIDQIYSKISNKNRTTQNHQQICKMQLQVRIKKVQIQNLQVKVTLHEQVIKQISYQLYVKCRETNKQLQIRTLPQFNNKLSNYINMLLDYEKRSAKFIFNSINQLSSLNKHSEKSIKNTKVKNQDHHFMNNQNSEKSLTQLFQQHKISQKSQNNLKIFFQDLKKFYRDINVNLDQTVSIIENYQKELFQKANSQSINQNIRKNNFSNKDIQNDQQYLSSLTTNYTTNLFYDRYFLNVLGSLSRKDQKIFSHSLRILEKQSNLINEEIQTYYKPVNAIVYSIYEKFKKVQEQRKKLQKNRSKTINLDQFQSRINEIQLTLDQLRNQLLKQMKNKQNLHFHSFINELTNQILQKNYKIYQYILVHQKKSFHFEAPTQKEEQQQDRNIKFKQYQLYVLKVQKMNFDDPLYESLTKNNQNRIQAKKKPATQIFSKNSLINPKEKHTASTKLQQESPNKQKHIENKQQSLKILNRLLGVLFQQWSNSEFFHDLIKQQLQLSLNFKRPGVVQPIHIEHLKVEQKSKESGFQDISLHASEIYRCLFDVKINFKGKIAVHIKTSLNFGNRTPVNINLLIKKFVCPIRICFNPYTIAKSYVSLLQRPHLNVQYDVKIGQWHINKIPFFSQIIKLFIVLKLRKKMVWPKRITLSVPLAFKNPIGLAIRERILFQNEKRKRKLK